MRIITETFEGAHLFRFSSGLGLNGASAVVTAASQSISELDGPRCYSTGPFDGTRGLPLTLNGSGTAVTPSEIFTGFFFLDTAPSSAVVAPVGGSQIDAKHRLMSFWSGTTGICTVKIDPVTQKLQLFVGAFYWLDVFFSVVGNVPTYALAANSTQGQAIVQNTVYHCQIRVKLDGANSIVQVKLDDTLVIDWTGTLPGTTMDRVMLHSAGASYADTNGNLYIDSIVINDTTAAVCAEDATWTGIRRFKVQLVAGPGTYAQFTPVPAVANYLNVDDVPNDADTTINYALTTGLKDSFPTSPHGLSALNVTFKAWFQEVIARKDSGTFQIKLGVRRAGVDYIMATGIDTGISYDVFDHRLCQDPSSLNSWTGTGLDSTEIIYQND